ncbi:DUF2861 family protein [Vibrio sp. T187]|uniref:DUF2861 family protein n=1 Tax=Vibrio TaxID=662 RepID=UPI0010CA1B03|nr:MULTISPECIES: DUF2861 family protein [Vibrio]MBW3698062.1 DUF2861 family protein [Vibrio sp. T187]
MLKRTITLGLLFSLCNPAQANDWFKESNSLTQVHKHILDNDLPTMFSSLVEVWQSSESKQHRQHLNELFAQSLNKDCGKSLTKPSIPEWLNAVTVRRHAIQSPGRDTYRLVVEVESKNRVSEIDLTKWVDKTISTDSDFNQSKSIDGANDVYKKRYNLGNSLESGLYRLTVSGDSNRSWSTWIVLGEFSIRQQVRWSSKDSWIIDKKELLNPYCPLPTLDVGLYDYVEGQYEQVWGKTFESDYPKTLENNKFSNDRYVLAVSMNHARWQGDIVIEQTQTISKTYDISSEEELK